MTWWWWIIIFFFLIVGIAISGWGLVSFWDYRRTSLIPWSKKIKNKAKVNFTDELTNVSQQPGIILIVVGNQWKDQDEFLPFYLFGTNNCQAGIDYWTKKLIHDQTTKHPSPIIDYLSSTNQQLSDINFYFFRRLHSAKNLTTTTKNLIELHHLNQNSWNKILNY